MNITELLNMKVKHKVFGEGIITEVSDNYLMIKFTSKQSKFVYPDAFEKFIVAENTSVQAEILEEINATKQAAEVQRQVAGIAHKAEKRHVEEKRIVLSTKNKRNIEVVSVRIIT